MSTNLNAQPDVPSKLGIHRQLAPKAGVHVSPFALGAMSIGDAWEKRGFGAMNKESSFKLLDAFYEAGGNFIDTANSYQDGTSEQFIGEWMEERGIREQLVIATKYTANYKRAQPEYRQKSAFVGNSVKSMHNSVEASLKNLRTDYVDILYVHWWDHLTSIEEVMNGLHTLVMQGKVLYLGASDTPAWVVAKANTYARMSGRTPFVIYQGAWSILERDVEREIIPVIREEGMAMAPWNVLAGGKIRTDEEEKARRESGERGRQMNGPDWERTEDQKKVCKALERVAKDVGAKSIQAVAIAYVMQKVPHVFPILGGRKVEQLRANMEALEIALSDEQIAYLESVLPFVKGFPYTANLGDGTDYGTLYKTAGHFQMWPRAPAIRPSRDHKS